MQNFHTLLAIARNSNVLMVHLMNHHASKDINELLSLLAQLGESETADLLAFTLAQRDERPSVSKDGVTLFRGKPPESV